MVRAVRRAGIAVGKRVPGLLTVGRAAMGAVRAREYRTNWAADPVDPAVVVFDSFEGRGYTDSPRAIYRAMLRDPRFASTEKVWVLRANVVRGLDRLGGYDIRGLEDLDADQPPLEDLETLFGAEALEELKRAVIVPWRSREYRRSFARAGLWVSNTVVPVYMALRPGQRYLQTWHGTPLKRLGCDIPLGSAGSAGLGVRDIHLRYRQEGARLTWLVSPSRYATERFTSAFDLAALGRLDAIVEEGYPRNDFLATFTAADVARIRERLGVPEGKKVVLYAPTWRETSHDAAVGYVDTSEADYALLRDELGDEYVILFRAHCLIASEFDFAAYGGFVIDVSAVDDINDLYVISDVLVTDYSSVFFDYASLLRPSVFFMYDLDEYAGDVRGLYLGLDELPGPIVRTTAELIAAVRAAESPTDADVERRETFRARFTPLDDGHASERVIQRMLAGGALRPDTDVTGGVSPS